MTKAKAKDCCKVAIEQYNKLTPKQKIVADVSVGAVVGLGVGIIIGLILNKKR